MIFAAGVRPRIVLRVIAVILASFPFAASAAPKSLKSSFVVGAQVLQIDCTSRPEQKKACAPVVIVSDKSAAGSAFTVVTTVLFY